MDYIVILCLGLFIGRYAIDILDNITSWINILTQDFQNKQQLRTAKIQKEIDNLQEVNDINNNSIGFQIPNEQVENYDENN